MIEFRNTWKGYRLGHPVVQDFSHTVPDGACHALVGRSGCGKSTLLNLVAGFIQPDAGLVLTSGIPVTGPGADRVMVTQDDAVFPWLTVYGNVEYGLRIQRCPREDRRTIVDRLLRDVHLTHVQSRWPKQLSGGERKRVDLARALALKPTYLLLDEPFASLDPLTRASLQVLMSRAWAAHPCTVLMATHDIEEAIYLADQIVVFGASPTATSTAIDVPFCRPRDPGIRTTRPFQRLRRHILGILEQAI